MRFVKFLEDQLEEFVRDASVFGSFFFFLFLLLLVNFLGLSEVFARLLFGALGVYLVSFLARAVYFKSRPSNRPYFSWFEKLAVASFPSIHAGMVWMYAIILGNFFESFAVTFFLALVAVIVCYSRVHLEEHDLVDVSFGALLGVLFGFVAVLFL